MLSQKCKRQHDGVTQRDRHRMRTSPETRLPCTIYYMVISADRT